MRNLRRNYCVAVRTNCIVSNFKMGVLGMSLMIIITNNTSASILALVPLMFRCNGWVMGKIEELCADKIRKLYKRVYTPAYISDIIVITSIFYFVFTRKYDLMVVTNVAFLIESFLYAPLFAVYSYVNMRVFGGNHHLSVFKNKHTNVTSQYDNLSSLAGGLVNLAVFYCFPEEQALVITMYGFLALFTLDMIVNYWESRYTIPLLEESFSE